MHCGIVSNFILFDIASNFPSSSKCTSRNFPDDECKEGFSSSLLGYLLRMKSIAIEMLVYIMNLNSGYIVLNKQLDYLKIAIVPYKKFVKEGVICSWKVIYS